MVAPRIGMGPEEAYFCSKFFNTLHSIEAPNFNRYKSFYTIYTTASVVYLQGYIGEGGESGSQYQIKFGSVGTIKSHLFYGCSPFR